MGSRYVIIIEAMDARTTEDDIGFDDDVQAMVQARRLFVHELFVTEIRPLSLVLGRRKPDGEVDWLSRWSVAT